MYPLVIVSMGYFWCGPTQDSSDNQDDTTFFRLRNCLGKVSLPGCTLPVRSSEQAINRG